VGGLSQKYPKPKPMNRYSATVVQPSAFATPLNTAINETTTPTASPKKREIENAFTVDASDVFLISQSRRPNMKNACPKSWVMKAPPASKVIPYSDIMVVGSRTIPIPKNRQITALIDISVLNFMILLSNIDGGMKGG
jgi:hypothetical protein